MSNTRGLSAGMVTELGGGLMKPHIRCEMELPSGTIRLWNGRGDLTADDADAVSQTWSGDIRLLGFDQIEETIKSHITRTNVFLAGTDNGLRFAFMDDDWHGNAAKLWLALMDRSNPGTELGVLIQFYGTMDDVELDEDVSMIALTIKGGFVSTRNHVVRLTDFDIQRRNSGDLGGQYVTSVQRTKIQVERG
ncbi:hypothetical protein LCGC14_0626020 [marine sediment metagenome]|uniref:Uncharacterized protein n=1 Tax=marine sediment metagenome TaxID=412755 RepID=A0A0F9RMR7_9ZZZZ